MFWINVLLQDCWKFEENQHSVENWNCWSLFYWKLFFCVLFNDRHEISQIQVLYWQTGTHREWIKLYLYLCTIYIASSMILNIMSYVDASAVHIWHVCTFWERKNCYDDGSAVIIWLCKAAVQSTKALFIWVLSQYSSQI